jgi:hypothetical protein
MDVAAHQFSGGSIDHPMPFERRDSGEARGGNYDVEMTAFACPGMTGVPRAVVTDFEQAWVQGGFERCTQPLHARTCAHGAGSFVKSKWRSR